MTPRIQPALSVLLLALLQACGGGGSDATNTASTTQTTQTTQTPQTNTGSASVAFVRGSAARYQLSSPSSQAFGVLTNSVQASGGAVTTLGTNVLSGALSVQDIHGDATYALGRWTSGTVTNSSGATTLNGTDGRAYHYIALNLPGAFPTSGSLTCDTGVFTTPTYSSGGSGTGVSGSATGSASLSFSTTGATLGGTISVAASGSSGSISLNGAISTPTQTVTIGSYFSNGPGAYLQIGDAGTGAYLIASTYAVTLANGSRYIGVAKFRCS